MGKDDSNGNRQLEPEQFRKMFIGGLSLNTTDDMLREFYGQWGEILDCIVMKDPQTKKSRGFGFVSYASQAEVDKAMAARPHLIDGKTIDPKRAVPREQSAKSESNVSTKRLYVSGIREEHTEEILEQYFADFGKVEKAEIIREKSTGKPRGFAFINFDDYDPVDKCVLQRSHMIKSYRCDVKKALSKEEIARAQQLDKDRSFRGDRSRGNTRGGPASYGPPPTGPSSGYGPGPWGPPSGGPPAAWGGWGPGGGYGGGGYDGGYGGGKPEPAAAPNPTGWGGSEGWSASHGGPPQQAGGPPTGGQSAPGGWGPPTGWQQQSWGPPSQSGGWSQPPTGGWQAGNAPTGGQSKPY